MTTGVYEIVNTVNGKRYIGSAVNFMSRWRAHRHLLENGKHSRHFQASWNKYGAAVFEFRKLLVCQKETLIMYEQRAIDMLKPEYNVRPKAENNVGLKHSAESRANMSASKIGRMVSAETRAKISASNMGNKNSLGKQIGHRKYFLNHTAETRAKLSAQRIGMKLSAGTLAKMAAARVGRTLSAEHRANISAALKGGKRSAESRKKIGDRKRRFNSEQAVEIRALLESGSSQRCVGRLFSCSKTLIADVLWHRNGY